MEERITTNVDIDDIVAVAVVRVDDGIVAVAVCDGARRPCTKRAGVSPAAPRLSLSAGRCHGHLPGDGRGS